MTIQNPPIFIQAGSHPAEDVRRWISAGFNDEPGIVLAGDLLVTEKAGTPNMSVDVAGGRAFVAGSEATYQGLYFAENRGSTNMAVASADATNPRIDLVVMRVRDSAYSGAADTVALEVVTGTPAASPVAPSIPDNAYLLATFWVAALATAIVDANITDNRAQTYALGADGGRAPFWQGKVNPTTVTGSFTTLTYSSSDYNSSIFVAGSPSPGVIKVQQAGVYAVHGSVSYFSSAAIGAASTYTHLLLEATGVSGSAAEAVAHASGRYQDLTVSYIWRAAANDTIAMKHADTAFRSLTTRPFGGSLLSINRLGDI